MFIKYFVSVFLLHKMYEKMSEFTGGMKKSRLLPNISLYLGYDAS